MARNQDNLSECGNRSICRLLFQWTSSTKIHLSIICLVQRGIIIISSNLTCSCHNKTEKIVHLALSNDLYLIEFHWKNPVKIVSTCNHFVKPKKGQQASILILCPNRLKFNIVFNPICKWINIFSQNLDLTGGLRGGDCMVHVVGFITTYATSA